MNLDELQQFCKSLPGVTEDVKWEDHLCFNIGDKMFVITGFEEPVNLSLKVADEEFDELATRPGFEPAPYLARYKWVRIEDAGQVEDNEMKRLLQMSYELVKYKLPKKKLKELGLA